MVQEEAGRSYLFFPPSPSGTEGDKSPPAVCGKVALVDLVRPHRTPESPRVALQNATGLDELLLFRDDRIVPLEPDHDGGLGLISIPAPDKNDPLGAHVLHKVAIGSAKVRVYSRQLAVDIRSSATARATITLAGLVDEERLERETQMVPPGTFYWAVLLVGMGALSIPLAKLWLLGRRSRLRRRDVASLATAAVVSVFLSTILFLAAVANNGLGGRLDARLKSVADQGRESVKARLQAGARDLDAFLKQKGSLKRETALAANTGCGDHAWGFDEEAAKKPKWTTAFLAGCGEKAAKPKWTAAFLAGFDGDPFAKFVPGCNAPSVINIAERSYFERARHDDLQCISGENESASGRCQLRAAADIVRSAATGRVTLVLARRASSDSVKGCDDDPRQDRCTVGGLLLGVDDFIKPILPLGFSLVVLDQKGTVLLHSGHDAHHAESFFDDVDDPRDLKATLAARAEHALDIRYAGSPSRAYVEHLPGIGWDVVTLARSDLVDIPTTSLVMLTSVALALVVFGFLLFAPLAGAAWVLVFRAGGQVGPFHLRPSGAAPPEYARFGAAAFGAMVLLCLGSVALAPRCPGWLLLAADLAVIVGFGVWLRHIQRPRRGCGTGNAEAWKRLSLAYSGALLGATGLLVVAPTCTLFMTAYEYVAESIVVSERMSLVGRVVQSRAENAGDNACPAMFDDATSESCTTPPPWKATGLLTDLFDLFPPLPGVRDDLSARAYRIRYAETTVPVPSLSLKFDRLRLAALVGAFLIIGLAAVWVTTMTIRRLFFVDAEVALRSNPGEEVNATAVVPRRSNPGAKVDATTEGKSLLLIHAPQPLAEAFRKAGCVDLSPQSPILGAAQVGLIPDLLALLDSPTAPGDLARALSGGGRAVVLSSADPWRRLAGQRRTAWAKVLANFEVKICAASGGAATKTNEASEALKPSKALKPSEALKPEAVFIKDWSDSDDDEKRVLAQLAIDRHPSPNRANCATMVHLARRGLLDVCTLAIHDHGFADFVSNEMTSTDLDAIERSEGPTPWKTLRVPLLTLATALVTILGMTAPELQTPGSVLTVFPAVFAAIHVVLRALGAQDPPLRA
jgi:hypothetical protein